MSPRLDEKKTRPRVARVRHATNGLPEVCSLSAITKRTVARPDPIVSQIATRIAPDGKIGARMRGAPRLRSPFEAQWLTAAGRPGYYPNEPERPRQGNTATGNRGQIGTSRYFIAGFLLSDRRRYVPVWAADPANWQRRVGRHRPAQPGLRTIDPHRRAGNFVC